MTSTSELSLNRVPADATAEVSEFGRKELRSFPGPASSEPLRLESITLAFGGVTALKDFNLAVAAGEIRAIIGPNGAGKSSLLHVISGIYRPQRGLVWIDEQKFARVPTQQVARLGIARTFQNLALFKGLSVLENIVIGRTAVRHANFVEQIVGLGRACREQADAHRRAEEIVDFLDLGAVRDRWAGTLPYGLQKRVELARALVARPKILLLDEPMAGMTPIEKQEMGGSSVPRATNSAPPSF
jgi:branched-chain amino acid transport system ATP-binding protein